MAVMDILKNITIHMLQNFSDRAFGQLIDVYFNEKLSEKYQMLEDLEEAQIKEPVKFLIRKTMPAYLLPYSNKEVLLGFTWCPFCQEEYQQMKDKIIEDKADVIWIDNDLVGEVLAEDLDLDAVPAKVEVKAKKDKAIVKLLDVNGNVVKTVKYHDILELHPKREKLKKTKKDKGNEKK